MDGTPAGRMDEIYRYQRHIYNATRAYYLFGRDRLISELDAETPGTTILEVACGTGRNLIRASHCYPHAQLFGFDISNHMLQTAKASVARNGRSSQVKLARGDATEFDVAELFGVTKMDRVFVSYALSMVPDWRAVVHASVRCLAPGGRLMIVDFGTFDRYPKFFQTAQKLWLRQFSVEPIAQLDLALAKVAKDLRLDCRSATLYGGYSVLAELRRPYKPVSL